MLNRLLVEFEKYDFIKSIFQNPEYEMNSGKICNVCNIGRKNLINSKKDQVGMTYKCINKMCIKEKCPISNTIFYGR